VSYELTLIPIFKHYSSFTREVLVSLSNHSWQEKNMNNHSHEVTKAPRNTKNLVHLRVFESLWQEKNMNNHSHEVTKAPRNTKNLVHLRVFESLWQEKKCAIIGAQKKQRII